MNKFEGGRSEPAADFDLLGKKAVEILGDLIPFAEVRLRYIKATSIAGLPGADSIKFESRWGDDPRYIIGSLHEVPRAPGWRRELAVLVTPECAEFFRSGGVDLTKKSPRELQYAFSICIDVSSAWARQSEEVLSDVGQALSQTLSTWTICHIAADLFCPFPVYMSEVRSHDVLTQTLAKIVCYLGDLASQRVEQEQLSHGIIIARPLKEMRPLPVAKYPESFQRLKRTPILADGVQAALWISPSGEPIGWITRDLLRKEASISRLSNSGFEHFGFIAEATRAVRGLGVVLRRNGSIIMFAKGAPIFMRRGTRWRGLLWKLIREVFVRRFGKVGGVVFDAALQLSFSGHGGVLGILEQVPRQIHKKDRVDVARRKLLDQIAQMNEGTNSKTRVNKPRCFPTSYAEWVFHALLPDDLVTSLGSSTLAMLASIDGATIMNPEGRLLAYGAVVPSKPIGSEGARSAAARNLSASGIVIKVSEDGPITIYEKGEQVIEA